MRQERDAEAQESSPSSLLGLFQPWSSPNINPQPRSGSHILEKQSHRDMGLPSSGQPSQPPCNALATSPHPRGPSKGKAGSTVS